MYKEYLHLTRDGVPARKRNLETVEQEEERQELAALIASNTKRIRSNPELYKPFPELPEVTEWLPLLQTDSLRFPVLLLLGFFFARCCLGKVPGGAPFSQLHKGIGSITRTGQIMQVYKPKQIQTKQRQQQIPNCGGREDETDARAVRPNSLARCIE